jgi:photosystem II stability/assembly factor-like uncharacterized protein
VVRSTNGGQNWTTILNAATPAVAGRLTVGGYTGFSKVVVALAPPTSPANPGGIRVLYASMVGTPSGFTAANIAGLFLSQDQGASWTAQTFTGGNGTTYGGYAFYFAVDPDSPGDGANDIVYFGTLGQVRSTDAGASFAGLNGLHADTHTWAFAKKSGSPTIIFCGNDGGIFQSTDGVNFTSLNGGGLQTGLFYNLDVKPDATASVTLGVLQDNGVATTAGAVSPAWQAGWGGDGFDVAHDGQIAAQVYARSNGSIGRSTNDGGSFAGITPPFPPPEQGVYLAAVASDPSQGNVVYASGSQNLWQSTDGGATWPNHFPIPSAANEVDVAPTNNNNVVVAVGGQVFVSTDALVPGGFTFKNITRDLPGRNVTRVAFDPTDSTAIYAVLSGFSGFPGGHVFRTTLGGSTWTDISPPLDLPFNAVALDGSVTPTAIYAGTDFGVLRSVDGGANWSVLDDIHLPAVPVFELVFHHGELRAATFGRGVFSFVKPQGPAVALALEHGLAFGTTCQRPQYLTLTIYNVGAQDLVITSVQRLFGSADFVVLGTPLTPLIIQPGEEVDFAVRFDPSTAGVPEQATIRVISNDPGAPFVDIQATGEKGTGAVATAIASTGNFGNVCLGSFADEPLTINNSGVCPLTITSITGSADFLAPGVLSYPIVVGAGDSIDVEVRFQPSTFGPKAGAITIFSDDPAGIHTVHVFGMAPAPKANLIIANAGNFGKVCVGSFADEPLIVTNSGMCTLKITGIVSSSSEFLPPQVISYPITIGPGDALPLPIQFQPASFGAKSATITVSSDDPASPLSVQVSGVAPPGKLTVAGSTTFGGMNACCCADRTLSICNTGDCALNITSVHFKRKSRHWKLLHNPFPEKLRPGSCLPVVIQYHATERCSRICELVIESDDPITPVKCVEVQAYTVWDSCCREDCEDCRKGCCERKHSCRQGYPCCCEDRDVEEDEK